MSENNMLGWSTMGRVHRIHFIGIGGSGMSGIAEVLRGEGYEVSGSDQTETPVTKHLQSLGVIIKFGHEAQHVENVDVVVISTAILESNPEWQAAIERKIPVIRRAEMLAELMRFRYGIAIAGTHGKTTTTSLVTSLLFEGELDPTFVIGGKLNSVGTNAKLGSGPYLVAEADESDASFLFLMPRIAVVTNIDKDHMATYHHDFDELQGAFIQFLHHLPFYGLAVLCIDDPVVAECLPRIARPIVSYGFSENADIRAVNWHQEGIKSYFTVVRKGHVDFSVVLNLPGQHNVCNALAAIAIALELGVSTQVIQKTLENFQGVGRRFNVIQKSKITLVDDYGHHPREMAATLAAARAVWPNQRIILVFQPHRYSRTQELFSEFVDILEKADSVLLLDIYSAGEAPIEGINSLALYGSLKQRGFEAAEYMESFEHLQNHLASFCAQGDVILMQGAGSVGQMFLKLVDSIE